MTTAITKKTSEYTDPFAPVEIQPVSVAGETVPTRVAVRVKDDAGNFNVVGIVGKDYQLVTNRKLRDIADDIMARSPETLGGFQNLKTLFNGKVYVDYFFSNNPITAIRNGTSLELSMGLMVWGAYDGTRKYGFEVFALNGHCFNEYHSRNRFGFFALRHTPGEQNVFDVDDALNNVARGVQNIITVAPMIGELKQRKLSAEGILLAKSNVKIPTSRWGDVLDQLGHEEPNDFGLYQALTNVASHKLTGLSAIDVGSSITDYFLPVGDKKAEDMGGNYITAEQAVDAVAK